MKHNFLENVKQFFANIILYILLLIVPEADENDRASIREYEAENK